MWRITGILLLISINISGQNDFNTLFTGETMRLDFVLAGNATVTQAYFSRIIKEKYWYGSRGHVKEPHINGNYYFGIVQKETGKLIYEKSFNTLFGEWQTTEAAKTGYEAFQQTVYFPCPKEEFSFLLYKRRDRASADTLLVVDRNPEDFLIPRPQGNVEYTSFIRNGNPSECVDIAVLAEGYTLKEKDKFLKDARRVFDYFFSVSPFKEEQKKFNIHAVFSVSQESGTDNPGDSVWVNTVTETGFYTFGSERYLTTSAYWKICDQLTNIPKDHICILVNDKKYGGGGIFNHYSISTVDNQLSEIVFVHEFGHGFAGLGDEYYSSAVAYEDFFDLEKEPLPPNLTTLVDFDSKWKDLLEPGTPIPTPVTGKYKNSVGVFEGGGYMAKGVYRPAVTCKMKDNDAPGFCKVCQKAIREVIDYYCPDSE